MLFVIFYDFPHPPAPQLDSQPPSTPAPIQQYQPPPQPQPPQASQPRPQSQSQSQQPTQPNSRVNVVLSKVVDTLVQGAANQVPKACRYVFTFLRYSRC